MNKLTLLWFIPLVSPAIIRFFVLWFRNRNEETRREASTKWRGENIIISDENSWFFGAKYPGHSHSTGAGFLLLTNTGIRFHSYLPKREFCIDHTKILNAEKAKKRFSISEVKPSIRLEFINESEKLDGASLYVRNPDLWLDEIKSRIRKK